MLCVFAPFPHLMLYARFFFFLWANTEGFFFFFFDGGQLASLVDQVVKNLPAMQKT